MTPLLLLMQLCEPNKIYLHLQDVKDLSYRQFKFAIHCRLVKVYLENPRIFPLNKYFYWMNAHLLDKDWQFTCFSCHFGEDLYLKQEFMDFVSHLKWCAVLWTPSPTSFHLFWSWLSPLSRKLLRTGKELSKTKRSGFPQVQCACICDNVGISFAL